MLFAFGRKKLYNKIDYFKNLYQKVDTIFTKDCETSLTRLSYIATKSSKFHDNYSDANAAKKSIEKNEKTSALQAVTSLDILRKSHKNSEIKKVLSECEISIENYEIIVEKFKNYLNDVLKDDIDFHERIVPLKDDLRNFKQFIAEHEVELNFLVPTFNRCFHGLDEDFNQFEVYVDKADYEVAEKKLNDIKVVLNALNKYGRQLPEIVPCACDVLPNKIKDTYIKYRQYENQGIPLYHLNVDSILKQMVSQDEFIREKFYKLDFGGAKESLDKMIEKLNELEQSFEKEKFNKDIFEKKTVDYADKVYITQGEYVRVLNHIPEYEKHYVLDEKYMSSFKSLSSELEDMVKISNELGSYINANLPQPYSILLNKANSLEETNNLIISKMRNIETYLNNLNNNLKKVVDGIEELYKQLMAQENKVFIIHNPSFSKYTAQIIDDYVSQLEKLICETNTLPVDINNLSQEYVEIGDSIKKFIDKSNFDVDNAIKTEQLFIYANNYCQNFEELNEKLNDAQKLVYEKHDFENAFSLIHPLMDRQQAINKETTSGNYNG